MQPTVYYAHPTTHRRRSWRKILLIAGVALAVPVVLVVGFVAWFQHEMTRNGIEITVDNRSGVAVDAMLFETGAPTPTLSVTDVAAGKTADRDKNVYRVIGSATFRVRVGTRDYEGYAGTLLDDDGPHRFRVKAFDDHVVVTRQSNEGPWDLSMAPPGSGADPAK
jgi:hypothetical protein